MLHHPHLMMTMEKRASVLAKVRERLDAAELEKEANFLRAARRLLVKARTSPEARGAVQSTRDSLFTPQGWASALAQSAVLGTTPMGPGGLAVGAAAGAIKARRNAQLARAHVHKPYLEHVRLMARDQGFKADPWKSRAHFETLRNQPGFRDLPRLERRGVMQASLAEATPRDPLTPLNTAFLDPRTRLRMAQYQAGLMPPHLKTFRESPKAVMKDVALRLLG